MIYTEDRDTFARDLFRPPFLARMIEDAGRYTGRMSQEDRDWVIELALDRFWELRNTIYTSYGLRDRWIDALNYAVASRPRWRIWYGWVLEFEWVKGSRWRGWRD